MECCKKIKKNVAIRKLLFSQKSRHQTVLLYSLVSRLESLRCKVCSFNSYTFALVSLLDAYNIPLYLYLDFTVYMQTLNRSSKQVTWPQWSTRTKYVPPFSKSLLSSHFHWPLFSLEPKMTLHELLAISIKLYTDYILYILDQGRRSTTLGYLYFWASSVQFKILKHLVLYSWLWKI